MARHVVVVGASLAGLRAVEALRRRGHEGSITLIGDEAHPPYDRPPLSKQVLCGAWAPERVPFRQKEGYDPLNVDVRTGVRATSLERFDNRVALSEGGPISFDGLVIATGAGPRTLPGASDLSGVFVLRTLDDALALKGALVPGARVVVVGAGFIGLEVASACRSLGLPVTAVELAEVPLSSTLGEPMGRAIMSLHADHGVEFCTGVGVQELQGEGCVEAVLLSDGRTLAADVVVLGIGVRPNVGWLEGSGVEVEDGVVCDETCATSRPNVVAAGDVASFYNPRFGIRQRVEHWTNAGEMADAAVRRLLEGPEVEPYAPVPYFWSDQYDVKIQFAGHVQPGDDFLMLDGAPGERKLVAVYGREGRLTGAVTWNRPPKLIALRRAIGQGGLLSDVKEA